MTHVPPQTKEIPKLMKQQQNTQRLFSSPLLSSASLVRKQDTAMACSVPPSNQGREKPSVPRPTGAAPTRRSAAGKEIVLKEASPGTEDFEFCVLSSGGPALAGEDAADMCAADEVFSGGRLLPFRLSSATLGDASALQLLRSDSLDGATKATSTSGFSSRSSSRAASSSSSSSCVSRSTSSKSASSDPASFESSSNKNASSSSLEGATKPPRRSLPSSLFYAHPSPSPRPPRRSTASAVRRGTGSAPPVAWGIIRLGVVGAPVVYPRKVGAARAGSQSARLEHASAGATNKEAVHPADKKLGLRLLGAGLVCSCSLDAVEPVGTAEAAAAKARRRRTKARDKKRAPKKQSGQSTSCRSRIRDWLEELSMLRTKNVA